MFKVCCCLACGALVDARARSRSVASARASTDAGRRSPSNMRHSCKRYGWKACFVQHHRGISHPGKASSSNSTPLFYCRRDAKALPNKLIHNLPSHLPFCSPTASLPVLRQTPPPPPPFQGEKRVYTAAEIAAFPDGVLVGPPEPVSVASASRAGRGPQPSFDDEEEEEAEDAVNTASLQVGCVDVQHGWNAY
jgi:hypothetical protein